MKPIGLYIFPFPIVENAILQLFNNKQFIKTLKIRVTLYIGNFFNLKYKYIM